MVETMEGLEVGAFYELKDGHAYQRHKKVDRRVFRFEGEAPGPKPTGWFLDLDTQKFHAFRLADMVEATATRLSTKGRTVSGKPKRTRRSKGKAAKSA